MNLLLFEINIFYRSYWLSLFTIRTNKNDYSLFHIEYCYTKWKFDFLFLRTFIYKLN